MMEFERALILSDDNEVASLFSCVSKALSSAERTNPNVSNGNDMEQARACLLALGVDFILEAAHSTNEQKEQGQLKQAIAVAVAVALCDDDNYARQKLAVNHGVQQMFGAYHAVMQKIGDLCGGGLREVVSFFAKRLECSCLKETYKQVKAKGDKRQVFVAIVIKSRNVKA